MKALEADFYARPVLQVARELIGCTVARGETAGVIVETEAYHESEPACHAFVGVTQRTKTLFERPGIAYVYRSYGIHSMLNAVCEPEGVAAAVLIRALEPVAGLELMGVRRGLVAGRPATESELCSGPGKLAQALGVSLADNGSDLTCGPIQIFERFPDRPMEAGVVTDRRIGISRAVELPWRFCALGSTHVSKPWPAVAVR